MGTLYQRGKSKVWWIKFYRGGKPFYESSRSTKKRVAKRLLDTREGQVADGRFVGTRADKIRFEDMAQNIVNDYKANGRKSLGSLQRVLERLKTDFAGRRAVDITTADVRAYIARRQTEYAIAQCETHKDEERCPKCDRRTAPATIMNELAALKRMFNLSLQAGEIFHRPYIPRVRVENARKGFLGEIEHLSLRESLPVALKPVLDFAYVIPWRKSEVLGLTWDRVDLDAGTVRLDTSKNYAGRVVVLPATLHETLQRLHDQTLALAEQIGKRIPWVFHRNGRPIRDFRGAWAKACKKAGVPGMLFHDLRRTGVRNMVRAGIPERVAMTISGHKTRSIFDRYNIVSEGDLRDAARKMERRTLEPVTENVTVPIKYSANVPHSNQDADKRPCA
jgi:integrase